MWRSRGEEKTRGNQRLNGLSEMVRPGHYKGGREGWFDPAITRVEREEGRDGLTRPLQGRKGGGRCGVHTGNRHVSNSWCVDTSLKIHTIVTTSTDTLPYC